MRKRSIALIILGAFLLFFTYTAAQAKITLQSHLEVRILYDGSGSMYPGYRIGPGHTPKSRSNVGFFHDYPDFLHKLTQLIALQTRFNGNQVSMTVFIEDQLRQILPPTHPDQINQQLIVNAFDQLKKMKWGQHTYLTENLKQFVNGFEGVVWLVTDNIIDTSDNTPDSRDIYNFFLSLRDNPHFHAVHLFKYPFKDLEKNADSNLAVYGILVSPDTIAPVVVEYFDDKFAGVKELFPGQEHLKLQDLSINPIELEAPIIVELINSKRDGWFRERQKVRLILDGRIRSNLTHHTIKKGARYRIAVQGPFTPDKASRQEFGVEPIASNRFEAIEGRLQIPIPPLRTQKLKKIITSKEPITIDLAPGFISFIKSAFGMRVKYTGNVSFALYDLNVKLERDRLAGIYGIDEAAKVFDIQDVKTIHVEPRKVPKVFYLQTGSGKALFVVLLALLLLAVVGFLVWVLVQTSQCRIKIDQNSKTVAFRRFGTHVISHEGAIIGTVKRGFGKEYRLAPSRGVAHLTISQNEKDPGKFQVNLKGKSFIILIEPVDGGLVKKMAPPSEKPGGVRGGEIAGAGRRMPGPKKGGVRKPRLSKSTSSKTPPPSATPSPSSNQSDKGNRSNRFKKRKPK